MENSFPAQNLPKSHSFYTMRMGKFLATVVRFHFVELLREAHMSDGQAARCRIEGCDQAVPAALRQDGMCLDHFVDNTYSRARRAVEAVQRELPLAPEAFEWMFEDAKLSLKALVRNSSDPFREGVMELITSLANVHEYLRQQHAEAGSSPVPALDPALVAQPARRAAGHGRA
jgi:hypothetical protein